MKTYFPPNFISAVSLIYSDLLNVKSRLENPLAQCDGMLPQVPDIFNPVIRFAVCSDIHNQNERFQKMMRICYEFSEKAPGYKRLDAVLVAGDFTGSGKYDEMVAFHNALQSSLRPETTPIICIGNHEYFDCNRAGNMDNGDTETKFFNIFGMQPDMAYQINGFTFLTASYDAGGKHFHGREKHKFYQNTVKKAIKEAPEKPVFVVQHPHPRFTVYGSINWADSELDMIWRRFPNVVNFSGHSHYPMNDPRSVWQGGYTALGTASLKYFELENELQCGFHGSVPDAAEQFYIVEADEKGSVLIRCYDLYSDDFFGEKFYIEKPADRKTYGYTYKNREKSDPAPRFDEDAFAMISRNEKGEYLLNFSTARDQYVVHDYKVIIRDHHGKIIYSRSALSDYFMLSRASKYMSVNLGNHLKKGQTYSVSIYACNSFYKLSAPLKAKVQIAY